VQKALLHLLGPSKKEKVAEFWHSYVEGCARISYRQFLEGLPIQVEEEEKPAQGWARVGIRQWSPEGDGLRIGEVEPLSCAAMVGLMRGDVLYTVDTKSAKDIDPGFWDQLPVGAQVLLGWRHEDEIAEGLLRLEAHRIPLQKRLRLTPLKEGFGTRD
jgi:predicted metalloprotease with PDZ domain